MIFATSVASTFAYDGHKTDITDAERAEHMQQMEEHRQALESAIKNNDFNAFQALQKNKKSDKHDEDRAESNESKMQEKFSKLVTTYNETWELPIRDYAKKKRSGKYFTDKQKGIVRIATWKVSEEKMERAVRKIDMITEKLSETDDEKILDMLLGIREVLMEKLSA